ncbi:ATP-binding protein [Paractinoplanes atraurantiacus]|uniref:Anti-sigma regulatory factor (Ser/Thr protein kinase) n=1 Tax=Paractinoplanes atraurantiacus TaxID=1036182 RepID=A0A285KSU2_9ACTN|nr:ATP-binding protein [Actinoplanes atraurantiacus]SNY75714.1 Anti-sigma regulatory factor (Ser/Thr protein kinase) [Actinoplanes atraurantiacus]
MAQRSLRFDVEVGPQAPGEARHRVVTCLREWGFRDGGWLDAVAVVVSEVVTNAVQHGGGHVVAITVDAYATRVTLSVADASAVVPRRREPDDRGGRGLLLLDALTDRWYVADEGSGKRVHVEFRPAEVAPWQENPK